MREYRAGEQISVGPGETIAITGFGIAYKLSPDGSWMLLELGPFARSDDAEVWMKERVVRYPGQEGKVITIRREMSLDGKGVIHDKYTGPI